MSPDAARIKIGEIRNDKSLDENSRRSQLAELYPIAESGKSAKDLGVVASFSSLLS